MGNGPIETEQVFVIRRAGDKGWVAYRFDAAVVTLELKDETQYNEYFGDTRVGFLPPPALRSVTMNIRGVRPKGKNDIAQAHIGPTQQEALTSVREMETR